MNEDLTDEQQKEVWFLACQLGIDTGRARTEWERRKAQNKPQPEPIQEEEDTEETEQEESEPSELEQLKLDNQKRIRTLLDGFYDDLEEEESQQEKTDDLIKFVKSDQTIEELTRGFCGLLLSFSRFPDVDKVTITMQKQGDKINFNYKMVDKNGSDVMFDSNGNPIRIEATKP